MLYQPQAKLIFQALLCLKVLSHTEGQGREEKTKQLGLSHAVKFALLKMDSVENKPREAYGKITALMFSENPLSRQ